MEGSSHTPGAPGSGTPARPPGGTDPRPRVFFHVDMDAFYAAIEARDDPSLSRVPLVIGADPKGGRGRGVVCTANYQARAYGIRSAMPIGKAYQLCPHATFLPPDFTKYSEASDRVMDVLAGYAGILEVVGMDEAYLDVTARCTGAGDDEAAGSGSSGPEGPPDWDLALSLARSLQAAVKRITGLSCSVGVAPNKSLAKVASDHRKPHGVTRVLPDEVEAFLDPLPVRALHGCGPKTAATLREEGYLTVGDLARATRTDVERLLGSSGAWLWSIARGIDPRPVRADHGERKSRGNERTYGTDQADPAQVRGTADRLAQGLLDDGDDRAFSTVTVKLRYADFTTLTRSRTMDLPLEPGSALTPALVRRTVESLLDPLLDRRAVRLVGVRFSGFTPSSGQQPLSVYGLTWTGIADPLLHGAPGPVGPAAPNQLQRGQDAEVRRWEGVSPGIRGHFHPGPMVP